MKWWAWLFLLAIPIPSLVHAEAITVSPIGHDVILQDDQSKQLSFTVRNDTNQTADIKLSVVDFGPLGDTGGVAFIGDDDNSWRYRLANWVRLETDRLTLAAGESRSVSAVVENRADLTPGGHYAAVIVDLSDVSSADGVGWQGLIASQFYVVKKGGEVYDLRLVNVDQASVVWRWPDKTSLSWAAAGNSHVRPFGTVEIFTARKRLMSKGVINQDSALLLPESERSLLVDMSKPKVVWPGKYYTVVKYHHQLSDKVESRTVEWWYIPLWLPIGMLLAIALIVKRRRV